MVAFYVGYSTENYIAPNRNMKGAEFTGKLVNTTKTQTNFLYISNDAKVNSILKVLSSFFTCCIAAVMKTVVKG